MDDETHELIHFCLAVCDSEHEVRTEMSNGDKKPGLTRNLVLSFEGMADLPATCECFVTHLSSSRALANLVPSCIIPMNRHRHRFLVVCAVVYTMT
mmetsp:Transcript_20588/g.49395  ORF Transcript_20588/g.49395 Transcript_20588/m.49395 type:complete len:96 (-) Transcript_20588:23-310(-)